MNSVWFKNVPKSEKERRRGEVLAHRNAFDDLKEVLEQNYFKKECVRDYDIPNWEYRQIAVNEYNAVLDDLLNLITLTER
jgi:hypothetical protein